jgi:hypothetical protein
MSIKVFNSEDELRAEIQEDGTVKDASGKIIGFINEDGSSGDADQNFLGEVLQDGQCVNSQDQTVGWVDLGKAIIRDRYEAYFCSVTGDGIIKDPLEIPCGQFRPFSYSKLKVCAAYLLLFDPNLVRPDHPSLVVAVTHSQSQVPSQESQSPDSQNQPQNQ